MKKYKTDDENDGIDDGEPELRRFAKTLFEAAVGTIETHDDDGKAIVEDVSDDAGIDASRAPAQPPQHDADDRGIEHLRRVEVDDAENQSRHHDGSPRLAFPERQQMSFNGAAEQALLQQVPPATNSHPPNQTQTYLSLPHPLLLWASCSHRICVTCYRE